ncbi:hypothetical protein EMIT019CA3_180033 [Bacillus pseudomycoides]|nr:hypothetical protein bmyco0003_58710 [Bacillus pseudomycoides]
MSSGYCLSTVLTEDLLNNHSGNLLFILTYGWFQKSEIPTK